MSLVKRKHKTTYKKVVYKPSPKAKAVWKNRGRGRIRLLEGAVRSSKSYTANDLALYEIQQLPPCNVLISGYSITSVARNIIAEWKKAIDPKNRGIFKTVREDKDEYLQISWRGLSDKKFYIRGAGKENDYMQIQGATFGYWLADELTRHCESFVDMALSRLSHDFSRATWTTNPDHPLHFVKQRFIDDNKLYEVNKETGRSEIVRFTFYLKDNPSLSLEYIESITKLYTGVFKQRYIYSQWVMAEGAIYDFFTNNVHCIDTSGLVAKQKYVSIDYGTHNPTCYLLWGRNDALKPKVWTDKEYYFDSTVAGYQKDDAEYANDFVKFVQGQEITCVFYDPSAASLMLAIKKALAKAGRAMVFKAADNSVLEGIRTQQVMLKNGDYRVGIKCKQTMADYGAYVWDPRAAKRGEDAPIKVNDHTKDAERYLLQSLFGGKMLDYMKMLR